MGEKYTKEETKGRNLVWHAEIVTVVMKAVHGERSKYSTDEHERNGDEGHGVEQGETRYAVTARAAAGETRTEENHYAAEERTNLFRKETFKEVEFSYRLFFYGRG